MRSLSFSIYFLVLLILSGACKKDEQNSIPQNTAVIEELSPISGLDLSFYPTIIAAGSKYYNESNEEIDLIEFIKKKGVNTVRLRLWVNPEGRASSLAEVDSFAQALRNQGLKIWLCLHYSDSWADPGQQETPASWQNLSYEVLTDSMRNYTERVMRRIKPEIVQIGNEINSGFLHPYGHLATKQEQFKSLLNVAIEQVRSIDTACKIMLHFAGVNNADWFFSQLDSCDFDLIGLSYYPLWHGKDLEEIATSLNLLSEKYTQEIIIAETSYPFTLNWRDWTNNVVGLNEQLILPDYPASEEGQKQFLLKIRELIFRTPNGFGFCYWGGEMVAFRSDTATNGSSWENQALFNFDKKANSAWEVFSF